MRTFRSSGPELEHVAPGVARARTETERDWAKAIDKIAERAGLTKFPIRGGNSFSTRQRTLG